MLSQLIKSLRASTLLFVLTATGSILSAEPVHAATVDIIWDNEVGVTVSGNSITSTASGFGNSGATSDALQTGDFGVQFTASIGGTNYLVGLSSSETNAHWNTIDFGLYLDASYAHVYEAGVDTGESILYTNGDVLEVRRTGSEIAYYKNGDWFYTSAASSSGAMLVDTALGTSGVTIQDVRWTGVLPTEPGVITDLTGQFSDGAVTLSWSAPNDNGVAISEYEVQYGTVTAGTFGSTYVDDTSPGVTVTGLTDDIFYEFRVVAKNAAGTAGSSNIVRGVPGPRVDVMWTDITGMSEGAANLITKTAATGWNNAGAASVMSFPGDFGIEFPVDNSQTENIIGFSDTNVDNDWDTIDYSLHMEGSGYITIIESGNYEVTSVPWEYGDVFGIIRTGTDVSYLRNGVVFDESDVSSTGTLIVDTALYYITTDVEQVRVFGDGAMATTPTEITDLSTTPADQSVVLSWTAPNNNGSTITGYDVQYGTVASGTFNMTYNDDASPGATLSGLDNHTAYQFRVVAINGVGDSDVSNTANEIPGNRVDVAWTDVTGGTAFGNNMTKTAATAWGNAGAASTVTLSGTLGIDFPLVVDQVGYSLGLSYTNTDNHYNTIDYSIYANDGSLWVYELGTQRTSVVYYSQGDSLQIQRIGSTVTYLINSEVFYTSPTSSSGDMIVDMGIYLQNGGPTGVKVMDGSSTVPGVVADLTAGFDDEAVVLDWTAPSGNGSAITGYDVEYGTVASGTFNMVYNDDATAGATITGLTNNAEYQFRVVASNGIGDGDASPEVVATPNVRTDITQWINAWGVYISGNDFLKTLASGAAGAASRHAYEGDVGVQWVAPEGSYNYGIGLSADDPDVQYNTIDYSIYVSQTTYSLIENGTTVASGMTWDAGDTFMVKRNGSTVTYFHNGEEIQDSGVSSSGALLADVHINRHTSTAEDLQFVGVETGAPGQPQDLVAVNDRGKVYLEWAAPDATNGADVTGYEVQYGTTASGTFGLSQAAGPDTETIVSGLVNGTEYQFRVAAINSAGTGTASSSVTATPSSSFAFDVVWTDVVGATASGNDLTKTAATAYGNSGGATTRNIEYDGQLDFTATQTGTARTVGLSVTNDDANYTSVDYGMAISIYDQIYVYESGISRGIKGTITSGDVLSIVRTGDTISYQKNSVEIYESTVPSSGTLIGDVAIYSNGGKVEDAVITVGVAPALPDMITDLTVTGTNDMSISLGWSEPHTNNSALVRYEVEYGTVSSGVFNQTYIDNDVTGATINGLINSTEYQFRVITVNEVGDSDPSNVVTATPFKPSAAAELISPTPGNTLSNASVTFTWSSGINVDAYRLTIDGTMAGGTGIADSGQIPGTAYGVGSLPVSGGNLYVRLSSLIESSWVDQDYVFATDTDPFLHFRAAGSGIKYYTDGETTQSVAYCLDADLELETANPIDGVTTVTYDLVHKEGTVSFEGTATDQFGFETSVFDFDIVNEIDDMGTSGVFTYEKANPHNKSFSFTAPASSSNPRPVDITYVHNTDEDLVQGLTVEYLSWPYPFNLGYLDYLYTVGSTDGQGDCGMDIDVLGLENSILPGSEVRMVGIVPVDCDDQLEWEVIPQKNSTARGKIVTDDARGTAATLTDITGEGELVVRVTNPSISGCQREILLLIGCKPCLTECRKGMACFNEGEIRAQWDLGYTSRGKPSGYMRLKTDVTDPANATPAMLDVKVFDSKTQVRYDGENLRQVIANEVIVDIDVIDQYTYDVHYYDIGVEGTLTGGVFVPDVSEMPLKSWRVENPDASPSVYNRLTITETVDSTTTAAYEYEWDSGAGEWILDSGSGLKVETTAESTMGSTRTVTKTVEDGSSNTAAVTEVTWTDISGHGEEMTERVEDPNGDALTTTYTYYDDSGLPEKYGRIESITYPDGSWVKYDYDSFGRMTTELSSWLDEPISADPEDVRVVTYDYTIQDAADSQLQQDFRRPRKVTETILDEVVSETFTVYNESPDGTRTVVSERAGSQGSSYGDSGNLRTVTEYYPFDGAGADSGRVKSVTYPDGRLDSYSYTYGTYTPDMDPDEVGQFNSSGGTDELHYVIHGTTAAPNGVANKSTAELTIVNKEGDVLVETTELHTGSAFGTFAWTIYYYDEYGHVTETYHHDGTVSENTWDCCNLDETVDRNGIEMSYNYDLLDRTLTMTKDATADVVTTYTYDAAGRRLTETVTSGTLSLDSETEYDLAGRIEESTDQGGLVTDYAYSGNNRVTTVTRPDSATEITEQYIDGRTKSVTGTGVVAQYFTYGVNTDGTRWTQVNISGSSSPNYVKTTTDLLGRTIKEERPGYSGTETTEYFYNTLGQLVRVETDGQADTLYEYDSLSRQVRSGLDVDDNGSLTLASKDRITDQDTTFANAMGNWWRDTVQEVYATDNNATPTTVSLQSELLTNLGSGLVSQTNVLDVYGNETVTTVEIDSNNKTVTRTVDYPDSNSDGVTVTVNGLLLSETGKTGLTATFGYDTLERRVSVEDPRTGTSSTGYDATTGWVDYVQDAAGNRTYFVFNGTTGRKTSETDALGNTTYFDYNNRRQVTRVWGDVPYPVEYVYDSYGRLTDMHTWRTAAAWTGASWPSGVDASKDVTTWNYQEATGLLTSKVDDDSESVAYTYEEAGRLKTRTWARSSGAITTTYTYDNATTDLTDIDYNDSTTDIDFTYDRLGRMESVDDALGSRDFTYNSDLQLEEEDISGSYNKTITRSYEDSVTGALGRSTGVDTGTDYAVTYDYDSKGRLDEVAWSVIAGTYTGTATYGYLANSDLIGMLSTTAGQDTTYTYEANRNLRTQIDNDFSSTDISQYDYSYDELGRREWVKNSGSAFAAAAFNHFDYNDRNELLESARYLGTDENVLTSPVTAEYRDYLYDPIGNRTDYTLGTNTGDYTPNNLNQYASENVAGGGSNTYTYDEDGNLTAISGNKAVTYTYDAENRLITAEPTTPAVSDIKLDFVYDYQGRRVEKAISTWGGVAWVPTATKRFVYDGWNVLEEQGTTSKYYVWGLDLSQSMQGAGGIGGLLTQVDIGAVKSYAYLYDGNGNVGQLIDNSDGSVDAHYEYDPYGNSIVASGAAASGNPYRFSTKYLDSEYNLYYFGYRYYDPDTGRWLSRDPEEEEGGINLYLYVTNDPLNYVDVLGLTKVDFTSLPPVLKGTLALNEKGHNKKGIFTINYKIVGLINFNARRDPYGIWSRRNDRGFVSIVGTVDAPRLGQVGEFYVNLSNIAFVIEVDLVTFKKNIETFNDFLNAFIKKGLIANPRRGNEGIGLNTFSADAEAFGKSCLWDVVYFKGSVTVGNVVDLLENFGVDTNSFVTQGSPNN